MKQLPIGISSFSKIREGKYVYVDKTGLITDLLRENYIFLSRPRRFGKSLLVDTIKEMFSGSRELFAGLAAYDAWDWEEHPVILINFAEGGIKTSEDLRMRIENLLQENALRLGVELPPPPQRTSSLGALITSVTEKYGKRVVLLVDEYDKPLLDNVTEPTVTEIRDELRYLYEAIKAYDAQLRFVLLTGVSRFSKVSIFSGLNNLRDISVSRQFSALCGYTQHELETSFADWLEGVNMAAVKEWYNGYNWDGEKVYNPFDILIFLAEGKRFSSYWFATGTPDFLVKILQDGYHHLPDYEEFPTLLSELGKFDIGQFDLESVLFQTGYLTITHVDQVFEEPIYYLGFPNKEVRSAFSKLALKNYLLTKQPPLTPMKNALVNEDIQGIENCFQQLFASIANDNYRNNTIANYEGYYAAVVYAFLASLGLTLIPEDVTNRGRIDLTIQVKNRTGRRVVYICEFKLTTADKPTTAIQQIRDRGYPDKYRDPQATIHLIGMEFDPDAKTLTSLTHALG